MLSFPKFENRFLKTIPQKKLLDTAVDLLQTTQFLALDLELRV